MANQKAIAVDTALSNLVNPGTYLEITSSFIKKWSEEARNLGGSLSATRIEKALKKMNLRVSVASCAQRHFQSSGWIVNVGKAVINISTITNNDGVNK